MKDDAVTTDTKSALPELPELQRLKVQNLFLQQKLCREQLNALTYRFLQTPQPKALEERVEELNKQLNLVAADIFSSLRIDPQAYLLNVEDGIFVLRNGIRS